MKRKKFYVVETKNKRKYVFVSLHLQKIKQGVVGKYYGLSGSR